MQTVQTMQTVQNYANRANRAIPNPIFDTQRTAIPLQLRLGGPWCSLLAGPHGGPLLDERPWPAHVRGVIRTSTRYAIFDTQRTCGMVRSTCNIRKQSPVRVVNQPARNARETTIKLTGKVVLKSRIVT
jgi:hypothetical protein